MKKLLKKLAVPALAAAILAPVFTDGNTAEAASDSYSANFTVGVYLKDDSGNIQDYYLGGTQYFYASQWPQYSGNPCGVKYQIKDYVWGGEDIVRKSNTQVGTFSNRKVDVSGPTGYHNVYLENYYSSSYRQYVSGTFNW